MTEIKDPFFGDISEENVRIMDAHFSGKPVASADTYWERRVEFADRFLRAYADGNQQKILDGYDYTPAVLKLAAMLQHAPLPDANDAIKPTDIIICRHCSGSGVLATSIDDVGAA